MHGDGLLPVLTIFVSAFLPSVETFRAFQYKDQEGLELVAKYWVVFGVWNSLEAAANLFYLTRLIPFYNLLKFLSFCCMYQYGHQFCFEIFSTFVDEAEPMGERAVNIAYEVQPFIVRAFNFLVTRVMTAIIRWQNRDGGMPKKSDYIASLASIQSQSVARSNATQRSEGSYLGADGRKLEHTSILVSESPKKQEAANPKNKEKQSCVII